MLRRRPHVSRARGYFNHVGFNQLKYRFLPNDVIVVGLSRVKVNQRKANIKYFRTDPSILRRDNTVSSFTGCKELNQLVTSGTIIKVCNPILRVKNSQTKIQISQDLWILIVIQIISDELYLEKPRSRDEQSRCSSFHKQACKII